MMFTGDLIDGRKAADWGLANLAVSSAELDARTTALAESIAGVPRSHLAMHKMVVNQVMLTMGLEQTQMMATVFDGITRHNRGHLRTNVEGNPRALGLHGTFSSEFALG